MRPVISSFPSKCMWKCIRSIFSTFEIPGIFSRTSANGFISVGGASTPEIRSAYMEDFIKEYEKVAGEWNDEAGTKVYALEIILNTLKQAGPEAIDDVEKFKAAMETFSMSNPYLKDKSAG